MYRRATHECMLNTNQYSAAHAVGAAMGWEARLVSLAGNAPLRCASYKKDVVAVYCADWQAIF